MTEDPDKEPIPTSAAKERPRSLSVPRPLLYLTLGAGAALLMLALALYGWRELTVRGYQERLDAQRTEMNAARRAALSVQAQETLRVAARPLGWAVRAELLKENLGQVDDYLREFVREPGVESVFLIGKEGRVVLATNRKNESATAESQASPAVLEATDIVVEESAGSLRLAVPIMSFSERLGVLVVDYRPTRLAATP